MTFSKIPAAAALVLAVLALSACGNTIRGIGKDTANTVDATQAAGKSVEKAAN